MDDCGAVPILPSLAGLKMPNAFLQRAMLIADMALQSLEFLNEKSPLLIS
jgi:hypothetical protein